MSEMFALIDGNSFYCSCERAFEPKLRGVPLVVLSNNDGCAIARTDEAKDLGVKMGDPWHIISKRPEMKAVQWRSSNYSLYGDMSRRVYELLLDAVPFVEPYSIDEMFMDYRGMPYDLTEYSAKIRETVLRVAKIPTCVGIGPTKTIAKLANKLAKKNRSGPGVLNLADPAHRASAYKDIALGEVWGMGRASVLKLEKSGVRTVADFVAMPSDHVRDLLTVVGLRTHAELRGTSCISLTGLSAAKKSLAVTRSFGKAVTTWTEMREAVASYATRAGEKLRQHGLQASAMQVFMHTNRFNGDAPYSGGLTVEIEPTANSFALIAAALRAARSVWRDGYRYQKAGVVLVDLYRASELPAQMFPTRDPAKSAKLMQAMDAINAREGRGSIRPAHVPVQASWAGRQRNVSPRYTTRVEEIMCARA
ncbi:Y-family DNA polymerase [bacterium]|nr:Y-family DNA polymerase [bacterium]